MTETILYHNPRCSKSRRAKEILDEHGVAYSTIEYLSAPPTTADLERILSLLGTDDPRTILRTKEADYGALSLADADRSRLLACVVSHPHLLERPIVIRGSRAVVARPPETLLELL